jgi:hypothetical protein
MLLPLLAIRRSLPSSTDRLHWLRDRGPQYRELGPRLAPNSTHFDKHVRPIEPPLGECPTVQAVYKCLRNHPEGIQAISRRSRSAPPDHRQGHAYRPRRWSQHPRLRPPTESMSVCTSCFPECAARPGANGYDPFRIGARGLFRRAKVNHRLAQMSCKISFRLPAK